MAKFSKKRVNVVEKECNFSAIDKYKQKCINYMLVNWKILGYNYDVGWKNIEKQEEQWKKK